MAVRLLAPEGGLPTAIQHSLMDLPQLCAVLQACINGQNEQAQRSAAEELLKQVRLQPPSFPAVCDGAKFGLLPALLCSMRHRLARW